MPDVLAVRPVRPVRGRPRSEAADEAIIAAVLDLLVEEGFGRLTMEGVATRAGVGKATVYRRWDNKVDLVIDAYLARCKEHVVSPDTGTLRGDLLAMYEAMMGKFRRDGRIAQAFAAEQGRYPELAEAFRAAFLDERRAAVREILSRGIARGELPPDADLELLGDIGSAVMWHRLTVTGAPLTDDLPERIVEAFFGPAGPGGRER